MPDQLSSAALKCDLLVVALPGVQRFIAEARSTSDVSAGSQIFAALAARAVEMLAEEGAELVLPTGSDSMSGVPNRVVALLPPGSGAAAARRAHMALAQTWHGWVRDALRLPSSAELPDTPGVPVVNWVCVPPQPGGYPQQWRDAQRLLAARRRVRDFPAVEWRERNLCSLAPRWPAEQTPKGFPPHEKAELSAVGWVKRRWPRVRGGAGFPSTASIASAPFRRAVLGHLGKSAVRAAVSDLAGAVEEIVAAVPAWAGQEAPVPGLPVPGDGAGRWVAVSGGPWVYEDRWQADSLAREAADAGSTAGSDVIKEAAGRGRDAVRRLAGLMNDEGVPDPAAYLAVLTQDIDSMGLFLSGEASNRAGARIGVSPAAHREVSASLMDVAAEQQRLLRDGHLLGVPVYAGGDDLLAFAPAATALDAASACHAMLPPGLPSASTAVVFFHYHSSLQGALSRARELLAQAKAGVRGKDALAVGYVRRSGAGAVSVQPWRGPGGGSTAELFGIFSAAAGHRLSPRLLADLERDADELARLSVVSRDQYVAELARLVRRHSKGSPVAVRGPAANSTGGSAARSAAAALAWLGANEGSERAEPGDAGGWPQAAARVAVFLRQEAR